jgi:hypothetical protein
VIESDDFGLASTTYLPNAECGFGIATFLMWDSEALTDIGRLRTNRRLSPKSAIRRTHSAIGNPIR